MRHNAEQRKKECIRQEEEWRRVEEGGYQDQSCEPKSPVGADRKNEWQKRHEERMPQSGPYPNAKQHATPYHRYTMRWQKLRDSQTDPSKKSMHLGIQGHTVAYSPDTCESFEYNQREDQDIFLQFGDL